MTVTWRPLDSWVGERCYGCDEQWATWDRVITREDESPLLEGIITDSLCDECAKRMMDWDHEQEEFTRQRRRDVELSAELGGEEG